MEMCIAIIKKKPKNVRIESFAATRMATRTRTRNLTTRLPQFGFLLPEGSSNRSFESG